ncbi:ATP-dependent nuclease [Providencia rettgeri]|uniref:ATP-dependent nuclease n=1 Tax=Providencia rettgeri TaxID=587 RepID=UPI0018E4CB1B|nr:AAA family ATPase [Providencia rettgeri]MBI6192193.1 AAA family ATPase [Providencia rettgeri]
MEPSKLKSLQQIFNSPKIEPFIRKLVFTNFKNIKSGQQLNFDYPITVLVGQNGTNKTSALVALFGSVNGVSPAGYWFTTPLDSVMKNKETGDLYQSYFYTYNEGKYTAEVFMVNNQRTDKNRTIDYWETARPQKQYGMNTNLENIESESLSKTRWGKIKKDVIYINFRSELSAFDRCLYHANKPSKHYKTKQEFIRSRSANLKKAISDHLKSFDYYQKDRIKKNITLTQDEVSIISKILNKKYTNIQYIEHYFFNVLGGTAYITTEHYNYSEAYAGSGEFAVISLVSKIHSAPKNSLILLDEPEVSLHPHAQKELINYLIDQARIKKHQIVISSHSPEIIENLPDEAIKLFHEDTNTGYVHVHNDVGKLSVFHVIGKKFNKIPIFCEDILAQKVIMKAIENDENLKHSFQVEFYPGGASSIISRFNTLVETNHSLLVLLDGDQQSELYSENNSFPDDSDISDKKLSDVIKKLDFELSFPRNTNSSSIPQMRTFLQGAKKYITYLPFDSPEYFIIQKNSLSEHFLSNNESKKFFKELSIDMYGEEESDAKSILLTQLVYLKKIDYNCQEFKDIRKLLNFYLSNSTVDSWNK